MKNYDPLDCSLTPELTLRPCITVIKPDTCPWAVTQSWAPELELDAAAPQFLPHPPTQTPWARMGSKEKEERLPPQFTLLVSTAFPLPSFLEFSPHPFPVPSADRCSPHMWSVEILQPSVSLAWNEKFCLL